MIPRGFSSWAKMLLNLTSWWFWFMVVELYGLANGREGLLDWGHDVLNVRWCIQCILVCNASTIKCWYTLLVRSLLEIKRYQRYNMHSDWSNGCNMSVYFRGQRYSVSICTFHHFKIFYTSNIKQLLVSI
jgi:hypothetical protein